MGGFISQRVNIKVTCCSLHELRDSSQWHIQEEHGVSCRSPSLTPCIVWFSMSSSPSQKGLTTSHPWSFALCLPGAPCKGQKGHRAASWHLQQRNVASLRRFQGAKSFRFDSFFSSFCLGLPAKSPDDNSAGHSKQGGDLDAVQHHRGSWEPQDVSKWQLFKRIRAQFLRGVSAQHHSKLVPAFSVICLFLHAVTCCY